MNVPEWEAEKMWIRLTWFLVGVAASSALFVAGGVGKGIHWGW